MGINVQKAEELYWDGLEVVIHFEDEININVGNELQEIVESWFMIGSYGGYGGYTREISKIWIEENEASFIIDMGSAEEFALDILVRTIEGFSNIAEIGVKQISFDSEK